MREVISPMGACSHVGDKLNRDQKIQFFKTTLETFYILSQNPESRGRHTNYRIGKDGTVHPYSMSNSDKRGNEFYNCLLLEKALNDDHIWKEPWFGELSEWTLRKVIDDELLTHKDDTL